MMTIVNETSSSLDAKERFFDQRLKINKIKFSKEELSILQKNLDKMVKYYGHEEFMSEVEQYQNKIIVYNEVADRLIKDYKMLRNKLNEISSLEEQPKDEFVLLSSAQADLSKRSESFDNFLGDLKENFLTFYTSHHVSDNHVFRK